VSKDVVITGGNFHKTSQSAAVSIEQNTSMVQGRFNCSKLVQCCQMCNGVFTRSSKRPANF